MGKSLRKVRQTAESQGWTLVRDRHHTIYRCPTSCGKHQVTTSSSSGTPPHFSFQYMRKCPLWDKKKES